MSPAANSRPVVGRSHREDEPRRSHGATDRVIEVPVELAPSRGLAIAAARTEVIRSGGEPGEALDVSRSEDRWKWLVRVRAEAE